jgi:hypothetical protein
MDYRSVSGGRRKAAQLLAAAVCAASCCLAPPRGAQAEQADLAELVGELLRDPDKEMRALGLEQIRAEAPGAELTQRFAALLPQLDEAGQTALLGALAARGDAAAKPAIRELLEASERPSVRGAAAEALGRLGDVSDCDRLIELLGTGDESQRAAARGALVQLRGSAVGDAIAAASAEAAVDVRVTLIEILAERRAAGVAATLLAGAVDRQPEVRGASMAALAALADGDQLAGMLRGVLAAAEGPERTTAEKAVMRACERLNAAEDRSAPLLRALVDFPLEERRTLLPAVGRVGGASARAAIEAAIDDADPEMHAAGVRALTNWPDATAAARLLELVAHDPDEQHRIAALRAVLRIAPVADGRTDAEKLALLREAIVLCQRDEERLLGLQRAAAIRSPATLEWAATYLDDPACAQEACLTIVELAHHRNLRESSKDAFDAALRRVLEISRDEVVRERARRYLANQTWVRPKPR